MQIFPLPKKVIAHIEGLFRNFLWTCKDSPSRKAHVSWDHVCDPIVAGGLNLISLTSWNKATTLKLLKMALAETVYNIWIIRNKIIFQDINKEELRSQGIIDMVLVRVELHRKLAMFCNRI